MTEPTTPTDVVIARPSARLNRPQRMALTAMLAIGLLGVGGVALVQAADPTSSPTTTTTTTTGSGSGTNGGSTPRSGHDCPNKNGSSSSTSNSGTTSGSN